MPVVLTAPRHSSMHSATSSQPATAFAAPIALRSRLLRALPLRQHQHFSRLSTLSLRRPNRRLITSCTPQPSETLPRTPLTTFTFAIGKSTHPKALTSIQAAISQASTTLQRERVSASVVFIFVKSTFEGTPDDHMNRILSAAKKALAMRRVLAKDTIIYGCTTAEYVGAEEETASVALVHFPAGTKFSPFRVSSQTGVDIDWKQEQWYDFVGMPPVDPAEAQMNIFLFQHPDFDKMDELLSGLDFAYPGTRKLGACAGKANAIHEAYLFDSDGHVDDGVIGLAFASPDVNVDVTVAQGARGVGPLMEVLEVRDGNEITKVKEVHTPGASVGPPMILLDMWGKADVISPEDRAYASKYLLFGVEVPTVADMAVFSLGRDATKEEESEIPESQKPIPMVIRKVVGFNESTSSLGIEGDVRLGSRVQFQIRDEEAARVELLTLLDRLQLEGSSKAMEGMSLMGAILLADTERGANLFGNVTPNLDRALYHERFRVPMLVLTSERQIGPLPAGGLTGAAGNTFTLSASALYVSFYGRTDPSKKPVGDSEEQ